MTHQETITHQIRWNELCMMLRMLGISTQVSGRVQALVDQGKVRCIEGPDGEAIKEFIMPARNGRLDWTEWHAIKEGLQPK